MIRVLLAVSRWWPTVLAASASLVAFRWMPADAIQSLGGEMVNFFGFVIAAAVPAMALSATALRGSGLSVKRVGQLHRALRQQMKFWAAMVSYGFISVAMVVVFKPIVGCGAGPCVPKVWFSIQGVPIDSRLCNAALAFTFALLLVQLRNMIVGLAALLDVNAEVALGEAQQRFDEQHAGMAEHISRIRSPEGYGSTRELPGANPPSANVRSTEPAP